MKTTAQREALLPPVLKRRQLSSWNLTRGMRVAVLTPSSQHFGKIGAVAELLDAGKVGVSFHDERNVACFEQSELRRVP